MSSNNDDMLLAAMRALRTTEPASPSQVEATQRRILATLAQRKQSPSYRPLAIAACSVMALALGSSAWAAATGHWPWQRPAPAATPSPSPTRTQPPVPASSPARSNPSVRTQPSLPAIEPSAPALVVSNTAPELPAIQPPASQPARVVHLPTPTVSNPARVPTVPIARPNAVESHTPNEHNSSIAVNAHAQGDTVSASRAAVQSPSDAIYQRGHTAQFVTRDMATALSAWDAYLHESPDGRYAPEARFNRAIALVRLGRRAEAVRALREIQDTSYRRADVTRLLEALEPDTSSSNEIDSSH